MARMIIGNNPVQATDGVCIDSWANTFIVLIRDLLSGFPAYGQIHDHGDYRDANRHVYRKNVTHEFALINH